MNLNLILPLKKIVINDKQISIPKLGLKHHELLKNPCGADENMIKLVNSICPGLNAAESEIVLLHVLEFNGKIKSEVTVNGKVFKVSDVYISQRLEHQYHGNIFYFRSPEPFETFVTPDDVLEKCFIRVNDSDVVPEFMDMPAFVTKWADAITTKISIKGPKGQLDGLSEILELFK